MTATEIDKHDKTFYAFWEKVFDEMPDDVLESTIVMIKKSKQKAKVLLCMSQNLLKAQGN